VLREPPALCVRELADAARIRRFMQTFGDAARNNGDCYFTGGATAVLLGWRATTVDVDILLEPEQDEALRALPSIKEALAVNVELASPADFIPLPQGWRERSISIAREGLLTFRHLDLYSQALAKIERGHAQDIDDARAMTERDLIEKERLRSFFLEIEPELYRFPAVDVTDFRRSLEEFLAMPGESA
jgi:hypothetical protein